MNVINFLNSSWFILFFYIAIVALVIKFRKKFEFQAKFIALYKTKIGLRLMKKLARRHRNLIILLGYTGIGIGFIGMVLITYMILKGFLLLFLQPSAPPTLSLVLPGVRVPGSPVFVPFWFGIIALFIVVVVHEFSHGLVSLAHNIKVKSSGLVLFGPIFGAFVEPDEKVVVKKPETVQYSVFAAGPFSNILLALLALLLMAAIINPAYSSMMHETGFSFSSIKEGTPAYLSNITAGEKFNYFNGEKITNAEDLLVKLKNTKPNQKITLSFINSTTNITKSVILAEHPEHKTRGYLGVLGINTEFSINKGTNRALFSLLSIIKELFKWIFILSLGIGLANLLPLGPVDGGRMLQLALHRSYGKKRGNKLWARISLVFFIMILILILFPIFKSLLGNFF